MRMQEALARLYAPRVPRDAHNLWFLLTFMNRAGPQRLLGPHPALWLDGRVVRAERRGPALAVNYFSVETETRVCIRFEGDDHAPSACFGPFERFSVVDRMVYAGGKAFALFNPRAGEWLCYDAGRLWPSMAVSTYPEGIAAG